MKRATAAISVPLKDADRVPLGHKSLVDLGVDAEPLTKPPQNPGARPPTIGHFLELTGRQKPAAPPCSAKE